MVAKTIMELRKEIEARERQLKRLQVQRRKIAGQLEVLDRRIAAVSGTGRRRKRAKRAKRAIPVRPRARARGKQSLSDVLAVVLQGKGAVKVADAAKLALAAGYKSASSQFANIVSQALTKDKRFRKIGRGVYASAGRPGPAGTKPPARTPKTAAKPAPKPAARRGRKGLRPGSLTSLLVEVLTGKKGVTVEGAAQAVLAKGYKSKSKNFRLIVNQTLLKGKQFKKVERGTYALKG